MAARNGWKNVVEYLIEKGADFDAKNNDNWTALHLAARNGWKNVVEYLIRKGTDIHLKNGYC